jgi:hypothetical protein
MKKDLAELERHLREIIQRLRTAAAAFDAGDRSQAARIAVDLRVLLHDTAASQSLLGLLGIKSSLKFIDTSGLKPTTGALMTMGGLAWIDLMGRKHFAPLDNAKVVAQLPFNDWWGGLAIRMPKSTTGQPRDFQRKDLVLMTANKDGGAHVDPDIDATYFDLTRKSSIAEVAIGGKKVDWDSNPVPCALRQMAYEVLRTLEEQASHLL